MRRAAIPSSTFPPFLRLLGCWTVSAATWILAGVPVAASASEVKIFRADTREAMLGGTLEGVSVDPFGALELAPRVERLAVLEEPFVFAAAGHPQGWVLGTGSSGKVLRVGADGAVKILAAVAAPQIFAVHADGDGTVYFGSSPRGKVYRVAGDGGEPEAVFDPGEAYVWDVARDRRGRLLVATGLRGRLYRVAEGSTAAAPGDAEILVESRDSHVRSLAVLDDGSLLVGTAGQGLILKVSPKGEVKTLHDAVLPEVLTFAAAGDGVVYAALMASEASQVDLSGQRPSTQDEGDKEDGESVSVVAAGEATLGSRSAGFSGPRSVIVEIRPDGKVEQVLEFQDETVHSLLWHGGGLWIGTGQEGRLYRYADRSLVRVGSLDEQQPVALSAGGAGAAVATANASAVYRLHDRREAEGTYVSEVLDAGQVARFGSFLWQGDLPRGAGVDLAFRSGMSSQPDDTWTVWDCGGCDAEPCHDGEAGCEGRRRSVALSDLASGRYVQWRATLRGEERTPRFEASELTYRQENLRPKLEKLEVLDPGQILVPQSFNPTSQTFEPWSPNREGIFTSLRRDATQNGDNRFKTLWKKGYRTLRWTAKDANDDPLSYRLEFRPEASGSNGGRGVDSNGSGGWLRMIDELDEDHYSFDSTVLPDGVYRFRLTAGDRPGGPDAEELSEEKLSEPVVIDHTPPELESVERGSAAITVAVRDALSPLRDAVISVDAGEWRPAEVADGLLDGRRETLRIAVRDDARMILLRLTDAHFNVVTVDLLSGGSPR